MTVQKRYRFVCVRACSLCMYGICHERERVEYKERKRGIWGKKKEERKRAGEIVCLCHWGRKQLGRATGHKTHLASLKVISDGI